MPEASRATKDPSAAEEGAKERKQRGSPNYPLDGKLTVRVDANPKRVGSKAHARFALYKTGDTVEQFMKKGGTYSTLKWDTEHGFVAINETPEQRKTWESDQKAKSEAKAKKAEESAEKKKVAAEKKKAADAKKTEGGTRASA